MELHNLVALWIVASLLSGLAAHAAIAAWSRRSYERLRAAYAGAVADAQETSTPYALVRAEELHRQFMRAAPLRWFAGLGAHLKSALVVGGLLGGGLLILAGRLPPAMAGLALLFLLGLRRILVATALLVVAFVASSLLSPPRCSERVPAAALSSASGPHKTPARPR